MRARGSGLCLRIHNSFRFVTRIALIIILFITTSSSADTITRRGAEPELTGEITTIDDNGVTIRSETNAIQTVTWDRIRDVQMHRNDPGLQARMKTADDIWRARTRLERGDAALAEPLFVRLFENYRGKTNETALVVTEGLLRCNLARFDHEGAVIPALELMRLQRVGVSSRAYSMLPAVIDESTGLCTKLAPAWADNRAVAALERNLENYNSAGDAIVTAVAREYRRAARQQLGLEPLESPKDSTEVNNHEGVQIIRMIVDADSTTANERVGARNKLLQRLDRLPSWAESWARYAIGASQLKEKNIDQQLEGLVQLLYLPAEDAQRGQSYLAGLALARAIQTLRAMGNLSGAESLLTELRQSYANHPALSHELAQATP